MLSVSIYREDLNRAAARLADMPRKLPWCFVDAINRGGKAMVAAASREIRAEYNIKHKRVKKDIAVYEGSLGHPYVTVQANGRRVNLAAFGARPAKPVSEGARRPRKGVSIQVKKSGSRSIIRGAFLQTAKKKGWSQAGRSGGSYQGMAPSGAYTMFVRRGKERLPIQALTGPAVPTMLANQGVSEAVRDRGVEIAVKRFEHNVGRVLAKMAAK